MIDERFSDVACQVADQINGGNYMGALSSLKLLRDLYRHDEERVALKHQIVTALVDDLSTKVNLFRTTSGA